MTNNNDREAQPQLNSLDFAVVPDRLSVRHSAARGIYLYGHDNNYPRKIIQSSERCSSLEAVKDAQAKFVAGNGFEGATAEDVKNGTAIVVNSNGQTLYEFWKLYVNQKTNINTAIHVNYNVLGEAVEFNLVEYDFVRKKIPLSGDKFEKFIITDVWHLEDQYDSYGRYFVMENFNKWVKDKSFNLNFTALECFAYNPDPNVVREQIDLSGGIDNYSGQLMYNKRTNDIYQKAIYDSLADKFQFLAENDLASLSNIQNGYSGSGILKYFGVNDGEKEMQEVVKKTKNLRGAVNTGRFITVPIKPSADMKMPTNVFESTDIQNKDKLYTEQKKEAKEGIQEIYKVPNSILGNDSEGNFATQNMQDAFDSYNTVTQPLRTECEIELTTLLTNSIFANKVKLPIDIEPLKYISTSEIKIESNENTNNN